MLSYWERQSFTRYDHVVVGSGLVGLSVALELKAAFPQARVLVLERGLLPSGASTRNAGFACMGSATELLSDLLQQPEAEVVALFLRRRQGLELLRQRLGDEALGYRAEGSFELLAQKDREALQQLDYLNALLRPVLGQDAFRPAHARIGDFGFAKDRLAGLIENTCEAGIDTGKAMWNLMRLAQQQGVEIKTGADVQHYAEEEQAVVVTVQDPFRAEPLRIQAATLSVCTNAFARQLLPGEELQPGRGQVLLTQPVPGLRLKGIFHYDAGYYYFRELDGRVLIGGGRNLDFAGEQTTEFALTEGIQQDLEQKLRTLILPGQAFEVDLRWSGIMAFGPGKAPCIKAFSRRVFGAFRMGGMGVALGSTAARELAALIVQHEA